MSQEIERKEDRCKIWSKFSKVILFTDMELKEAQNYLFNNQINMKRYEANGILCHSGIILLTKGISAVCKMTTVMKDSASTVFWAPIIYRRYQSAYSIINYIYRYSNVAKHSVIETIWRCVWKVSFILCCSGIVKKIKIHCERYLCLRKRTIDL